MKRTLIISVLAACASWLGAQITTNTNFKINSNNPIDNRMTIATLGDTSTISFVYEGLLVHVNAIDAYYKYNGATWEIFDPGGGSGDVTGPGTSTDNAVARFNGTGNTIQNSAVTIDDSGNIATSGTVDGRDVSADGTKLDGIESGATGDQSDAEIETAYNNQVSIVSQAEAEAGAATTVRRWTAERVGQAIAALAPAANAENGLVVDGGVTKLGGAMTADTEIELNSFDLTFSGSGELIRTMDSSVDRRLLISNTAMTIEGVSNPINTFGLGVANGAFHSGNEYSGGNGRQVGQYSIGDKITTFGGLQNAWYHVGNDFTGGGYKAGSANIGNYVTAIGREAAYRNARDSVTAIGWGAYNSKTPSTYTVLQSTINASTKRFPAQEIIDSMGLSLNDYVILELSSGTMTGLGVNAQSRFRVVANDSLEWEATNQSTLTASTDLVFNYFALNQHGDITVIGFGAEPTKDHQTTLGSTTTTETRLFGSIQLPVSFAAAGTGVDTNSIYLSTGNELYFKTPSSKIAYLSAWENLSTGIKYPGAIQLSDDDENILISTGTPVLIPNAQRNIVIGRLSGGGATQTGDNNTIIGNSAGQSLTSGFNNNMFGISAGRDITTGSYNQIFGSGAGQFTTTGSYNNFFGHAAGQNTTTGTQNNFFGRQAGFGNVSGSNNNVFGYLAGADGATTYTDAVLIGRGAGRFSDTLNNAIGIGAFAIDNNAYLNPIGIGQYSFITADNQIRIGHYDVSENLISDDFIVGNYHFPIDQDTSLLTGGEVLKFQAGTTNQISLSRLTASEVSYDNTTSGLTATDVKAAIDETVGAIPDNITDLTISSDVNWQGFKITNLGDGTASGDAATWNQVDTVSTDIRYKGFTTYTSDPSTTLNPRPREVYYFDTTTAGWTQVFGNTNLKTGDSFFCYFVSTDTNAFTLDASSGGFIRPNANGDFLSDLTEAINVPGFIELVWDGTDFLVLE